MTVESRYDVESVSARPTPPDGAAPSFPPSVQRVLEWLYKYLTQSQGGAQALGLREDNVRSLCEQMAGGDDERARYMYTMFEAAVYEWNKKYVEGAAGIVPVP